ncbi:MAG: acyl-CoA dehydrogenase family protein [Gammaproteobacteria bacterium]|nr:acyl-CoA dehydrogenase family protein [Gammaproteobacteria bacterium]
MDKQLETLRQRVREFAQAEIAPLADRIDRSDTVPPEVWKKIGGQKLMGITIPKKYGGEELSYLAHVIVTEELSRASGTVGFSYAAHSNICLDNLYRHGAEAQRKKYLPALIAGDYLGALAMSEPEAGSDVVGSMSCHAEKKGNVWVANGTKRWITNGPDAGVLIVYMRTADKQQAGSRSITAFLVEPGMKGFSTGEKIDKLGMRGAGNCELYFKDCEIPEANVLGEVNEGVSVLMAGLNSERLLLCGGPLGIMQAAMDVVLPYAHQREQFGQPIGNFQMVQAMLADMYTRLQAARALVYSVGERFSNSDRSIGKDVAAACLFSSQASVKVALDAIQIMGGRGYRNDEIPGRLLRDAKIYEIGGGTNEIRRIVIARDLLKESAPAKPSPVK